MHGQGYRGNNTDPTSPSYLGSHTQGVGTSYGRGAAIGRTENESLQRPFPSVPQNGGNQFPGFPSNVPKARMGGLIGELPVSSRTFQQPTYGNQYNPQLLGYGGVPQQMVAKLRIGADDPSRQSSQLSFYRGQQPSYGNGPPLDQRPGHPGLEPRLSAPPGGPGQYPSSSFSRGPESLASMPRGGSIGQMGQSGPSLIGRLPSGTASIPSGQTGSYAAAQMASPFVPASTSQPIIGGVASQYSMPLGQGGSNEEALRGQSFSDTGMSNVGSISNLGSISQVGSMSQMGSIGTPSLHQSTNPGSGTVNHSRSTNSLTNKVKAVCSSGGHFMKLTGGSFEYQGGETRLISVPNFCRYQDLLESLERLAGSAAGSTSGSSSSNPSLKYQLPSEPNVYVDLVDDEDTQLMFDDWHDYSSSTKGASKLHLFIDWRRDPSRQSSESKQANLGTNESVESMERQSSRIDSAGAVGHSADSARGVAQSSSAEGAERNAQGPVAPIDYNGIAGRMEVILPKDVSLVKYLGSGGYGEVYLGKWHSSEAAIKCLNPSLFFNAGQVSQAAIAELIREADLLGCLRHPNVVWVYGVVLPNPKGESSSEDDDSDDSSELARIPSSAKQQPGKGNVPGIVRPPAIVTEFMSQGSLKGALQRKADIVQGPLMRVLIAMDAAKGMEYLHQKNIVHFDLKSANLLLGWRDRRAICKVADFGLSKQKRETYVSNVSSQRGTLPWIAPEIIKSPHAVTEKVDVFSFGVVLWELWTGKEPYDGLNYHALLHQITTSDTSLRPALPGSSDWDPSVGPEPVPGYRGLMERCWMESPAGRPSFNQIVKVLKDMATALRPRKPRPSGSSGGRSSRLPSASLPQPSIPEDPTPAEPATAREQQPLPPPSQLKAEPVKAAAEPQSPQAGQATNEAQSPAGQMQNPFAAQAQKPMERAHNPPQDSTLPEAENSNIGDYLASAHQPATLPNPFKEAGGKAREALKAPLDKDNEAADTLSLGSTVGGGSATSSIGKPSQAPAQSSAPNAEGEQGKDGDEPTTPQQHRPAVSAFTAVAGQPGS